MNTSPPLVARRIHACTPQARSAQSPDLQTGVCHPEAA